MPSSLITGFLSGQSLIVAIGAQNSFVLRQGIRREHLLPIALICALSDAVLIGAGIAGLGSLIQNHPILLELTRYAGAAFLLAYGFMAGRRAYQGGQSLETDSQSARLATAVSTCLLLTFLNPHVYLDTVLLLGALANQHGPSGRWYFGTGASLASFVWFFSLTYGARFLRPLFASPRSWQILDAVIMLIMLILAWALLQS